MTKPIVEQEAILYIDRVDSSCGACGENADPHELRHDTVWSYKATFEGCHALFTAVSSNYSDHDGLYDGIRKMRPDLSFIEEAGWE